MSNQATLRGPGEGSTVLVAGSDYVTYKVRSEETERAYFRFEVSATPGFGPPPHSHAFRELFYVLDGSYEFTLTENRQKRTILGVPGTALAIEPHVPHTFRNIGDVQARLLITHVPAALEEFFEDFGVAVERVGEESDDLEPPDSSAMGAALARHGVRILADHEVLP